MLSVVAGGEAGCKKCSHPRAAPTAVVVSPVPTGGDSSQGSSSAPVKRKFEQEQPLVTVKVETSWSFAFCLYGESGSESGRCPGRTKDAPAPSAKGLLQSWQPRGPQSHHCQAPGKDIVLYQHQVPAEDAVLCSATGGNSR